MEDTLAIITTMTPLTLTALMNTPFRLRSSTPMQWLLKWQRLMRVTVWVMKNKPWFTIARAGRLACLKNTDFNF